jgi:hypothetical protein
VPNEDKPVVTSTVSGLDDALSSSGESIHIVHVQEQPDLSDYDRERECAPTREGKTEVDLRKILREIRNGKGKRITAMERKGGGTGKGQGHLSE